MRFCQVLTWSDDNGCTKYAKMNRVRAKPRLLDCSLPARMLSGVVLPQPLGPTNAVFSPPLSVKEMLCNSVLMPLDFEIELTVSLYSLPIIKPEAEVSGFWC